MRISHDDWDYCGDRVPLLNPPRVDWGRLFFVAKTAGRICLLL